MHSWPDRLYSSRSMWCDSYLKNFVHIHNVSEWIVQPTLSDQHTTRKPILNDNDVSIVLIQYILPYDIFDARAFNSKYTDKLYKRIEASIKAYIIFFFQITVCNCVCHPHTQSTVLANSWRPESNYRFWLVLLSKSQHPPSQWSSCAVYARAYIVCILTKKSPIEHNTTLPLDYFNWKCKQINILLKKWVSGMLSRRQRVLPSCDCMPNEKVDIDTTSTRQKVGRIIKTDYLTYLYTFIIFNFD